MELASWSRRVLLGPRLFFHLVSPSLQPAEGRSGTASVVPRGSSDASPVAQGASGTQRPYVAIRYAVPPNSPGTQGKRCTTAHPNTAFAYAAGRWKPVWDTAALVHDSPLRVSLRWLLGLRWAGYLGMSLAAAEAIDVLHLDLPKVPIVLPIAVGVLSKPYAPERSCSTTTCASP